VLYCGGDAIKKKVWVGGLQVVTLLMASTGDSRRWGGVNPGWASANPGSSGSSPASGGYTVDPDTCE
jgi:hypothetical protein